MTTTSSKPPYIRGYLSTEGIPWDTIIGDCDIAEDVPPLIAGEFTGQAVTTVPLMNRRDLEPWALKYRELVTELIKPYIYWTEGYTYEQVAQGCWLNRYRDGGRAEWHTHDGFTDLVVVWYLQADSSMGRFVYKYNGQEHAVDINTGDVLIFPGTLLHSTEMNNSGKERFIMANNICMTRYTAMSLLNMKQTDSKRMEALYKARQAGIYQRLTQ